MGLLELLDHWDRLKNEVSEAVGEFQSVRPTKWTKWSKWHYLEYIFILMKHLGRCSSFAELSRGRFQRLAVHKGLYNTGLFEAWFRGLLAAKGKADITFESLLDLDPQTKEPKGKILEIVASDLLRRGVQVFGESKKTLSAKVADAVVASMSIPIFFEPRGWRGAWMVDGGMLSNFAPWVLDKAKGKKGGNLPVLGFRLVAEKTSTPKPNSFLEYVQALIRAKYEGIDELQTRGVSNLVLIEIQMPPGIPFYKFNLTPDEKTELYERGYDQAALTFSETYNREKLGLPVSSSAVSSLASVD
jgi:NTE family protein